MLILALESSCDETSAAVVEMFDDGKSDNTKVRKIRSNIIASQIAVHALYGGVVPEIASRAHTEAISAVTREALDSAGIKLDDIDAIGVTNTPGLVGALLVGVNFAKSLAYAAHKPLIGVNHICGHVAANYFSHPELKPPFLALVASGGHTSLINVHSYTDYETIGRTRDDAIGEAFDKVARVMGLPYPGGAEMDRLASLGNADFVRLPSAAISDDTLDFSFSGLKTSVINLLHNYEQKSVDFRREDIAAAFTKAVTSSVVKKLEAAMHRTEHRKIVLAGGVSANSHLRKAVKIMADRCGVCLYLPEKSLCGDNGAMIGAQAYYEILSGKSSDITLNAVV